MATTAFDKEYIHNWVDALCKRRDKVAQELDWLYECRIDQLKKKVTRQLIPPPLADKRRQGYEFIYTTCVQNLDVSLKNLMGIREIVKYLCSKQPIDHPSTHAHYQDRIENLGEQQDALQKVHDLFRAGINQSINKLYLPLNLQCNTQVLISSSQLR